MARSSSRWVVAFAAAVAAAVWSVAAAAGDGGGGDGAGAAAAAAAPDAEWEGWGPYAWTPWADTLATARARRAPAMLVLWKPWCGACKALKPQVASSPAVAAAAPSVVLSASQSDAAVDAAHAPDGKYYPRILFFDPDGNHMADVTGGNAKYKYFHADAASLATAMGRAAEKVRMRYGGSGAGAGAGDADAGEGAAGGGGGEL
jgi:protein-disulfide reductase (glutathione)